MALGKRVATEAQATHKTHKRARAAPANNGSTRRITRQMSKDAAHYTLFNTTELVEQILLCLPTNNIYGVRRVSQKFNAVIATSPSIQSRLLPRLQSIPVETWVADETSKHGVRKFDAQTDGRRHEVYLLRPVVLNPLLKKVDRPSYFDSWRSWARDYFLHNYPPIRVVEWSGIECVEIDSRQGLLGNDPSFLKMYITDPPTRKACLGITAEYQLEPNTKSEPATVLGRMVESEDGLTFEDLLFARTEAKMSWQDETGVFEGVDIDLQEMMETAACPVVVDHDSYPTFTLLLFGVCLPTEEEWTAVSPEHKTVTS